MWITPGKGWCSDDSQSTLGEGLIEWRGGRKEGSSAAAAAAEIRVDSVDHFHVFPAFYKTKLEFGCIEKHIVVSGEEEEEAAGSHQQGFMTS